MFAVPLFAACSLPLNVTTIDSDHGVFRLSWPTIAGAKQYEVQTSLDNFQHSATLETADSATNGVTITQKTTRPQGYSYRVVASNPSNASDVQCVGTALVNNLNSQSVLVAVGRKMVIPIVGSTRGANNADFKTSMRLGPAVSRFQSGKIIFHPADRPGSDNDPSINYTVDRGVILQFDDIVGALGQSGIGSIDIISNNRFDSLVETLPVEVRLFNQAAAATYGGYESGVWAADAYHPGDWSVFVPSSRFRVNVGVRSVTPVRATFVHIAASSGTVTTKALDLPADYVFMQAADQFFGVPVQQGDTIQIHFDGIDAIAIPFHTFTDNSTNDPAVFNPASPMKVFNSDIEAVSITGG
jgi:hypothetical protein